MKVIDATKQDINDFANEVCGTFRTNIAQADKVLVVGVASGGLPLAKNVFLNLSDNKNKKYTEISCQRPSTQKKESGMFSWLFNMIISLSPKFVLNKLRVIEHVLLSKKRTPKREVKLNQDIVFSDYNLVIVVDDAIDSGFSLKQVVNFIAKLTSSDIVSAVYVTTQKKPVYTADYSKHQDILVRFPWSKDA